MDHDNDAVPAGIDDAAVTRWLIDQVEDLVPPFTYSQVAGGHSNMTFVVTDAEGARVVLRRPPLGHVLASAHDVVREHRIMSALEHTPVPVPAMVGVCSDVDVNGAPFFVMRHVDGVVLHAASQVADAFPDESSRRAIGFSVIDSLAALHEVDIDAVGLGELSRRGGYLDRQLKRWTGQWEASKTREVPEMDQLRDWLLANRPAEGPVRIVHGDYRLGNLILGPDGSVLAILDWELCTLGDSMADLAYLLRSWSEPGETVVSSVDSPSRVGGFPTRDELIERYRSRIDCSLDDIRYWSAFNAWRLAAIGEGVLRRYIEGVMGNRPEDLSAFERSVTDGARSGLREAGLL